MSNPDVRDIVEWFIETAGYDGLSEEYGECACEKGDLAPCGELNGSCIAGYKHEGCPSECNEGHEYHIMAGRAVEEKSE